MSPGARSKISKRLAARAAQTSRVSSHFVPPRAQIFAARAARSCQDSQISSARRANSHDSARPRARSWANRARARRRIRPNRFGSRAESSHSSHPARLRLGKSGARSSRYSAHRAKFRFFAARSGARAAASGRAVGRALVVFAGPPLLWGVWCQCGAAVGPCRVWRLMMVRVARVKVGESWRANGMWVFRTSFQKRTRAQHAKGQATDSRSGPRVSLGDGVGPSAGVLAAAAGESLHRARLQEAGRALVRAAAGRSSSPRSSPASSHEAPALLGSPAKRARRTLGAATPVSPTSPPGYPPSPPAERWQERAQRAWEAGVQSLAEATMGGVVRLAVGEEVCVFVGGQWVPCTPCADTTQCTGCTSCATLLGL